jgi:2-polyprenyl-6-hydroxyphenyl methylase/3-demethylubiquinone-9 3-methyltransferase
MNKRTVLAILAGCFLWLSLSVYRAGGSHTVDRPAGLQRRTSATEYEFADASGPWQEVYRPGVDSYLATLTPGAAILDAGCGNGSFLSAFRGRGWKLRGVDFAETSIQLARSRYPDVRFEVADATGDLSALGYGMYDAVISTEVIEHIYLPRKFIANCFRLLKRGGILVVSTPYNGYWKNLAIAALDGCDRHWDPLWDFGHIKFWSVDTLSRLLYEAGFEQVQWTGAGRVPYLWKNMIFKARVPPVTAGRK